MRAARPGYRPQYGDNFRIKEPLLGDKRERSIEGSHRDRRAIGGEAEAGHSLSKGEGSRLPIFINL